MSRRVLILNERDLANPRAGGAEVHLFEIFGRLAAEGWTVRMICAGFPGGARRDHQRGIEVYRLGNRYVYYAQAVRFTRRLLRADPWDAVVEAQNKLPFYTPLYVSRPLIVIVHHLFGSTAFRQVPFPVALAVYLSEKPIPRLYRKVPFVTISESSRQDLVQRGLSSGQVTVIPCGIDHAVIHADPAPKPGPPRLVFLGRVERYKHVDVVVRALSALRRHHPMAHLIVAGTGGALPSVRAEARRLRLEDCVEFRGFVEEEEKVRLLRTAHVVVQPSEKEGWGLTVLEANACGTTVVARDAPGLRDAVVHGVTGLLVHSTDPCAWAAAIDRVLSDRRLRERLERGALRWASRFRWETAAEATGRLIEDCCRAAPSHA